jgi:site-specific recombinase XerD
MQEYLEKTKQELRLRIYGFKTIKAYLGCLREYFDFKKFNLEKIDEENIKQFLLNKQSKNYSSQTVNLYLNAIKFFYREVLMSRATLFPRVKAKLIPHPFVNSYKFSSPIF